MQDQLAGHRLLKGTAGKPTSGEPQRGTAIQSAGAFDPRGVNAQPGVRKISRLA